MQNRVVVVLQYGFLSALTLLQSGCGFPPIVHPNDPYFTPVRPPEIVIRPQSEGSLYAQGYGLALYGDLKARRVGDVLTVVLNENTNATKNNKNTQTKVTTLNVQPTSFLGSLIQFNTIPGLPPLASNIHNNISMNGNANDSFAGSGQAIQNNQLTGSISVVVSEVLPNGNLVVKGEKWVTINTGDEYVRLTGIVRPSDITDENTVTSAQVADARISYSGKGNFQNSSFMGWLSNIAFSWLWPI
jgi:flagellar L-ring protein precursor FlgH